MVIQELSITQNLREINVGDWKMSKGAFFINFKGCEFWYLWFCEILLGWDLEKSKAFKDCQTNDSFWDSKIAKNDFK